MHIVTLGKPLCFSVLHLLSYRWKLHGCWLTGRCVLPAVPESSPGTHGEYTADICCHYQGSFPPGLGNGEEAVL
jgi:hypothetical protein